MSDDDLIRRGDAEEAAHEADSLELAQHGARLIAQRIASLPAVTVGVRPLVWEPTDAQAASACLSYRHDFGLMKADERQKLMFTAREWLRAWQKESAALDLISPADAAVKRVVDLLDDLTERQWVIDGLTMSELKEITDAIGAVREVQSHKSK